MNNINNLYATLRHKNRKQYYLFAGCCFFSLLLITSYICMMQSPTIINVLPSGGDSIMQVNMIFVLAVLGCGIFTSYAGGMFLRYKSREVGIFLALGMRHKEIEKQLVQEVLRTWGISCGLGIALGVPLALLIWQVFRWLVVNTQEMKFISNPRIYVFAAIFSVCLLAVLLIMLLLFIKRVNIMDIINESRRTEPLQRVPRYYGVVSIILIIAGVLLSAFITSICVRVFHWYPPDWVNVIAYVPIFIGIYLLILHTVVNGWGKKGHKYKSIISMNMMKFNGRQTVRNMLVITALVAGAYFAAFYTPMMHSLANNDYDSSRYNYSFHYRADQNMISETEIRQMAIEENVSITEYTSAPIAILGIDWWEEEVEDETIGMSFNMVHKDLSHGEQFLSESAYNYLMGTSVDVAPGTAMAVYDDSGDNRSSTTKDLQLITNAVTGKTLPVTSVDDVLCNTMLFGCKVLDDADYAEITQGLPIEWQETQVFFNVQDDTASYHFADRLFREIVDRSSVEVAVRDGYDPVVKLLHEQSIGHYYFDREWQEDYGFALIDYEALDTSTFRLYWNYMPEFSVLDKTDFVRSTAVYLMLFVFIAIICFVAVIIIAYTRSLTIAMAGRKLYEDLRYLGASNKYLRQTLREQISKVFLAPVLTGTIVIYMFYVFVLYSNDGRIITPEAEGLFVCILVILAISALLYGVYRATLRNVYRSLGVLR